MPGSTLFPGALDSHTGADPLGFAELENLLYTNLTADATSSATTLTVMSTTGFPTRGSLAVGLEIFTYTGKTATTFTGCVRGVDGTTAAAHAAGATVGIVYVAANHNDLAAAIVAIETKLGINASTPIASRILGADGTSTSSWRQILNADIAAAAGIAQTKLGAFDAVLAYKSATVQTIANTTETVVSLDAEAYDSLTMHDNTTNNSRLVAVNDGRYLIWGLAAYAFDVDGIREVYIRANGSTRIATGSLPQPGQYVAVFQVYSLTASQYVEMTTWHSAGNNLDISNGQGNCYLGMVRLPG